MSDVLCLFAHQDDEYGIAPRIVSAVEEGRRVSCIFLTDGSAKGSDPAVRDRESTGVLTALGINAEDILFLGSRSRVPDGNLVRHLEPSLAAVTQWVRARRLQVGTIYAPAWEGGHADHDACHLVAVAAARELGVREAFEFPLYNGQGMPWKFFRVLKPLRGKRFRLRRLRLDEGLHYALLCLHYRSQRRTWLGLLPEAFLRRAVLRQDLIVPIDGSELASKPHDGALLYERLFGVEYGEFTSAARAFRERHRLSEAIIPAPNVK